MKKLLIVGLVLAGSVLSAWTQQVEVRVMNDRYAALPYAYVYINGQIKTVTDTVGTASIPLSDLRIGDTISASYVGTEPVSVVWNDSLRQTGYCLLKLPELYLEQAEAVTVTAKLDVRKLFRKTLSKYTCSDANILHPNNHCETGRLQLSVRQPDGTVRSVDGQLTFYGIFRDPNREWAQWTLNQKIETADDTTGMYSAICHWQKEMYLRSYMLANRMQDGKWFDGTKPTYGYLGMRDGCRIFRLAYPDVNVTPGVSYQILVALDVESGFPAWLSYEIVSATDSTVHFKAGGTMRNLEVYRNTGSTNWFMSKILLCRDNSFFYETRDGLRADISTTDLRLVPIREKLVKLHRIFPEE